MANGALRLPAAHTVALHGEYLQDHESFPKFFECWLAQQERDLHDLRAAAAGGGQDEQSVRQLVERVVGHYEYYYRAKAASARRNVLPMFSPSWMSMTENLFLWCGGWRPTMAIQLLYSKVGLQVASRLEGLLLGGVGGGEYVHDLGELNPAQLERIDRLHRLTLQLERGISEVEASAQEMVVHSEMVKLTHALWTEVPDGDVMGKEATAEAAAAMELSMGRKREGMEEVLMRADALRLKTLKAVLEILRPMQAVHFFIAAAELHLKVRQYGKSKDTAGYDPT